MVMTKVDTNTVTYTKSRINVIEDHFELFLRCGNIKDEEVEKILDAVEQHELNAVGIYIAEDKFRIAEVKFEIDWNEYLEIETICGDLFDTDLPGWKDGVAPEAYVAVSRLVKFAKEHSLRISSYIIVSDFIRRNEDEHRRVCKKLGYSFGSSVPVWKEQPKEQTRKIEGLPEAKVVSKQVF